MDKKNLMSSNISISGKYHAEFWFNRWETYFTVIAHSESCPVMCYAWTTCKTNLISVAMQFLISLPETHLHTRTVGLTTTEHTHMWLLPLLAWDANYHCIRSRVGQKCKLGFYPSFYLSSCINSSLGQYKCLQLQCAYVTDAWENYGTLFGNFIE
jgi:hypothetical protein